MNLAIFGATGGTGMNLIQQAVNASHRVRALARTPEKLSEFGDRTTVIQGDVLNAQSVAETIAPETDAVLSALGVPPFLRNPSPVLNAFSPSRLPRSTLTPTTTSRCVGPNHCYNLSLQACTKICNAWNPNCAMHRATGRSS
jgi:hypothetical protein